MLHKFNSIAVFCGASNGNDSQILEQALKLGQFLAKNGIELVYGGAKVGLMGAVAKGALEAGATVTGVIPYFLQTKEVAHDKLNSLIVCESMHERKTKMYELSDAFIALPGGFGTMDELFEILTWAQLGMHSKPIGLLNVDGFFDPLVEMLSVMFEKGLLNDRTHSLLLVADDIEGLYDKMINYRAPELPKWLLNKDRT